YEDYPALASVKLADPSSFWRASMTIDVLIGTDYYYEFLTGRMHTLAPSLFLLDSSLGWILSGRCKTTSKTSTILSLLQHNSSDPFLFETQLENFWSLESIGIADSPYSNDDDLALTMFNASIHLDKGRYFVKWPWKEEKPFIPSNFELSVRRLKSLLRRLQDQPNLVAKYSQMITDQEKLGIIEKVTLSTEEGPMQHYIPHHCVIRPDKATTKVRIVYDASAKLHKNSPSLNESLFRGPVMLPDLCGLLLRFRLFPVVLLSDIEKAFLQVGLQIPDRDVTRFLWLRDPTKPVSDDNLEIFRFCRVPFGVISSPFLLAATVKYHLLHSECFEAKDILSNIYVDNVLVGRQNGEEAYDFYKKAKKLFSEASMNLREWCSNSSFLMDHLPDHDKVSAKSVGHSLGL
ncbi:MAG: hypothetical protein GY816_02970, partial [Cytophagales bacterium]|nr:hypothetical protein [Cytophagales bacterium]